MNAIRIAPKVGLMIDLETLDLSPNSVIAQVGVIAFPLDDPETEIRRIEQYLPCQPQIIGLKRTMSFSTIWWWMQQDEKARGRFIDNTGDDMEELLALVRSIHRKISEVIEQAGGRQYVEVWARGPQFDIVNLGTLFADCGLSIPWAYDMVMDIRTAMRLAGISTSSIDSTGLTPHIAIDDCKLQIRCYIEMVKHRGANS